MLSYMFFFYLFCLSELMNLPVNSPEAKIFEDYGKNVNKSNTTVVAPAGIIYGVLILYDNILFDFIKKQNILSYFLLFNKNTTFICLYFIYVFILIKVKAYSCF